MSTLPVVLFIKEWFKEWWGLMGTAVFTFLGIYVAAANRSNQWVVGASAVAGGILFFVASYRAWKRQHDVLQQTQRQLSEQDFQKAQLAAIREQTETQKAHTAELARQFDEQVRENSPITKAFRAVEEKEARTKMGLEPESEEYYRRVWLHALTREYIASHDNLSPALIAGTELPPVEWLNKRIIELNEAFQKQGKSFRLPLIKDS
jgi:hypothetical protein